MKIRWYRMIARSVFTLFPLIVLINKGAFAADGFQEFKLGSSMEEIRQTGNGKCSFGDMAEDTRWLWKKRLVCRQYEYKGVSIAIVFVFVEKALAKIYALSKYPANYFVLRDNLDTELLSKRTNGSGGEIDHSDVIFRERRHSLNAGHRLTYYFYKGNWEWEVQIESVKNIADERLRKQEQLNSEAGKGLTEWNGFVFGETVNRTNEKLGRLCESTEIREAFRFEKKILVCHSFSFLGKQVDIRFGFFRKELVDVELALPNEFYRKLLPYLKQKYGKPYRECVDSEDYFPYILFPKQNVSLSYKRDDTEADDTWVSLQYAKEDYVDTARKNLLEERRKKSKKRTATGISEGESILKSI